MLLGHRAKFSSAETLDNASSKIVERVDLDWNHSGKPTRFTLSTETRDRTGLPNTLTIRPPGKLPIVFKNKEDRWGIIAESSPALRNRSMVSSKRMFFFAAGKASDARIYLILVGEGSSCCVGNLTIVTADQNGAPKIVFHSPRQMLSDVRTLDDASGIQVIAKSSDSEAWALKNAESYDPFRIYVLQNDSQATYDLERSKDYTVAHYCPWAGPDYNENFGAIQISRGIENCRTMTRKQFERYASKHPTQYPQQ
jgi:hypothetical protein